MAQGELQGPGQMAGDNIESNVRTSHDHSERGSLRNLDKKKRAQRIYMNHMKTKLANPNATYEKSRGHSKK